MESLIPKDAKQIPLRPLALGEVTGHHHLLAVADRTDALMYEKDGEIYARANVEMPLNHQEHKPHAIPAGEEFGVRIATEVNAWGQRQNVAD